MKPEFSLTLLDVFTYLFPGALTVMPFFLFNTAYIQQWKLSEFDKYLLFFVLSYVVGHLLTLISSIIPRIFRTTKSIFKVEPSKGRKLLKEKLAGEFQEFFNYTVEPRQLLGLCRQLVLDHSSSASEFIQRLYTMSLFARNMAIVGLFYSLYFSLSQKGFALISIIISILFILRYWRLNLSIENAIYRSAFIYFKLQNNKK